MGLHYLLLVIVSAAIIVYVQFRYAWANYPNSLQWKLILFGSAFLCPTLSLLPFLLFRSPTTWYFNVLFLLGVGVYSGLLFTFLAPLKLQNAIPKRKETDDPPAQ